MLKLELELITESAESARLFLSLLEVTTSAVFLVPAITRLGITHVDMVTFQVLLNLTFITG